jgi:Zn-dependent M28 family amino/carboxypeptidase
MRKVLATGVAVAALMGGAAMAAETPKGGPAGIDGQIFSDHIKVLASDAFEGRGPDTPGEAKSIAYIAAAFKKAGLAPAGDNGSWMQAVPLRRFETPGEIKVGFTENGQAHPLTELQDIVVHTQVPTDHVTVKNAPLVFIGYGVDAPERHWDDFKGVDIKGKIAVVLINDPDIEMDPKNPLYGRFDGKSMTYYGRWTYKYAEAAKRGALGLLIVHETGPAAYGWNTVKNSNGNAQFDIVRPDPAAIHPKVEGWVQRDVAVQLFKSAGLDFEAEKKRAQTEGFKPVELKGATFFADYAVKASVITSHNVVGKVVGAKHPDEAVLYGAHWDHLGVGQPDAKGDKIYNGAEDNASGVAGLLELARLFGKAPKTERSVYFIGFTAEEKGLLGSEYYGTHPVVPLAKTVALLNLDGVQVHGATHDLSSHGVGNSTLDDLMGVYAKKQGREFKPDPMLEEGHFYRADHFSLAKVGVPALTLEAGLDMDKGGIAAGTKLHQDYVKLHYHQPADEWSPDWDMAGAVQDLTLYYDLGRDLANSREWPSWKPGSEFKAVRDKTAAARK